VVAQSIGLGSAVEPAEESLLHKIKWSHDLRRSKAGTKSDQQELPAYQVRSQCFE
jgi:hypothetical protein